MRKRRKYNLKGLIIAHLRKIFFFSPLRREALEKAKKGERYLCAATNKRFGIKEVMVDHINPVVEPEKGFLDWNTFISRLFCPVEELQVLSKAAHKIKTQAENKRRRESKQ